MNFSSGINKYLMGFIKNYSKIKYACGILIWIATVFSISSGETYNNNGYIRVNWQKGFVSARGIARVEFENGIPVDILTGEAVSLNRARQVSYDTAREISRINIAEAIKFLRVDPQNILLDIMKNDDNTRKKISDRINNGIIYKEYPADFDSSICEAKIPFGKLIESLPYDFPSNDFPVRAEIPISTAYSGLIVDCRGLPVKPMIFPSLYSSEGLEIYGRNFIQSNYAVKGGMVSYCYNEDQAFLDIRAGEKPYFANAIKSISSSPVLSEKDVRRILSSKKTRKNLKECRVILIIDNE